MLSQGKDDNENTRNLCRQDLCVLLQRRVQRRKGAKVMRRKNKCCKGRTKLAIIVFGAAVICLCLLSAKLTLVIIALALIAAGIWLLKCE